MPIKINGFKMILPKILKVVLGTQDELGNIVYEKHIPFYIKMQTAGTIYFNIPAAVTNFYYKKNDEDWVLYNLMSTRLTLALQASDIVSFKADTFTHGTSSIASIVTSNANTVRYTVGGDINSLRNYNKIVSDNYAFAYFFATRYEILGAESDFRIGITTISGEYCFSNMFFGCKNMTSTFKSLPARNLNASRIYDNMYNGCIALINAPNIFAKEIASSAEYCFYQMFKGCTSLTGFPRFNIVSELPSFSCQSMFEGCSALGEVPDKFKLSSLTIKEAGYKWLFRNCTNLLIPDSRLTTFLPATNVTTYAYAAMFQGCNNLAKAPKFPPLLTITGTHIFEYMFASCWKIPNIELPTLNTNTPVGYMFKSMFFGCTSITEVPAGTFEKFTGVYGEYCFGSMFEGCSNLVTVNSRFPDSGVVMSNAGPFQNMFSSCSKLENIPYNFLPNYVSKERPTNSYICEGMFLNCTSLKKPIAINWVGLAGYNCRHMYNGCTALEYICNLPNLEFIGNYCCNYMYKNTNIYAATTGYAYTVKIPSNTTATTVKTTPFTEMFHPTGTSDIFAPTANATFTCSVPTIY